jgi:peptide/nickel transport system permease protein
VTAISEPLGVAPGATQLPPDAEPRLRSRAARIPAYVGLAILVVWVAVAITVPLWSPHDPLAAVDSRLLEPGAKHLLGTDALGRDVFTRVLWGARISLPVAFVVILLAVSIGCLVGAVSGFFGGWIDAVLMRVVDITMAFPPILLAMAITASLGPSIRNALIGMVLVWWPIYARLLRAQVQSIRQREHVDSAVAIGAPRWLILRRYILPLSYTPVLVNATMDFGQVVLLTASLSFIGLGARPPSPEWGAMISEGATNFYDWWIAAGAGVAILTVVLGFNFLGDAIRDRYDIRER